jgi:acyl carrier protein
MVCGERRVIASGRMKDGFCTRCRQLFERICEALQHASTEITLSSRLTDLGVDSLDAVEFVMEFEEEYGIRIPDDEAAQLVTVRDLVRAISRHERGDSE